MNDPTLAARGVERQGLDAAFEAEETRKSTLILEARLLREQGKEEAASRFAEAAALEEELARRCAERGLGQKEAVHHFSAASCWAQAGDFYHAIILSDQLLARIDLPERLRRRIEDYVQVLRTRRAQWYATLGSETAGVES